MCERIPLRGPLLVVTHNIHQFRLGIWEYPCPCDQRLDPVDFEVKRSVADLREKTRPLEKLILCCEEKLCQPLYL